MQKIPEINDIKKIVVSLNKRTHDTAPWRQIRSMRK